MGSRTAGNKGWGTEVWTLKTGQVRMLQTRRVQVQGGVFNNFFFFFATLCSIWDISSPTRDGIPLQWKRRVLTTGDCQGIRFSIIIRGHELSSAISSGRWSAG